MRLIDAWNSMERELGSLESFERAAIQINRKVKTFSRQWQAALAVQEEYNEVKEKERKERKEQRDRERKEMDAEKKENEKVRNLFFFFYKKKIVSIYLFEIYIS